MARKHISRCLLLLQIDSFISSDYRQSPSEKQSDGFESNYVLDFLQHKADASIEIQLVANLFLSWNTSFQDRRGDYVDANGNEKEFKPILVSDAKIISKGEKLDLFVQASNVFDQNIVDIGNVPNPGRWMNAGLAYRFKLKGE